MLPSWFWPGICCWLITCGAVFTAFAVTGARAAARRAEIVRMSKSTGGNR